MLRIAIVIALVAGLVAPAPACWVGRDPEEFAGQCPIVLRGKIVAVTESKAGQKNAFDLADIEIDEILKCELKDVPLKVGGKLTVRMSSRLNPRSSLDLVYPVKTDAIWLVVLGAEGEFRIDAHPVQKQKADAKLELRSERRSREAKPKEDEGAEAGKLTMKEWVQREVDEAKREAEARERFDAEQREIRAIATELAKAATIVAESMLRHQTATVDTRRSVLQLDAQDQPLKGERLVEIAEFLLANDPDENIRTHAACKLGYTDVKNTTRAGGVLAKALKDSSRDVRMFACQALGERQEKTQLAAIRPLLQDDNKEVRFMAMGVLGKLGDKESLPAIIELYEGEKITPDNAWQFAESLANLGEKKISLQMARRAMDSENWNVRYFAVVALDRVDSVDVIPNAMECLGVELAYILAGRKHSGFDDRIYLKLCEILAKRTKKDFGPDPVAWAKWWDTARAPHFAPAVRFDTTAAKKSFAEYQTRSKPDR